MIPLRNRIKQSKLVSSFNYSFIIPMKIVSKFLLTKVLTDVLQNIVRTNLCLIGRFICLAGNDLCLGSLCSDQPVAMFLYVSQTQSLPHSLFPQQILHVGYKFLSFNRNKVFFLLSSQ